MYKCPVPRCKRESCALCLWQKEGTSSHVTRAKTNLLHWYSDIPWYIHRLFMGHKNVKHYSYEKKQIVFRPDQGSNLSVSDLADRQLIWPHFIIPLAAKCCDLMTFDQFAGGKRLWPHDLWPDCWRQMAVTSWPLTRLLAAIGCDLMTFDQTPGGNRLWPHNLWPDSWRQSAVTLWPLTRLLTEKWLWPHNLRLLKVNGSEIRNWLGVNGYDHLNWTLS